MQLIQIQAMKKTNIILTKITGNLTMEMMKDKKKKMKMNRNRMKEKIKKYLRKVNLRLLLNKYEMRWTLKKFRSKNSDKVKCTKIL